MEFLDFGGRGADAHDLGRGLARMHLAEPTVGALSPLAPAAACAHAAAGSRGC